MQEIIGASLMILSIFFIVFVVFYFKLYSKIDDAVTRPMKTFQFKGKDYFAIPFEGTEVKAFGSVTRYTRSKGKKKRRIKKTEVKPVTEIDLTEPK